MAFRRFAALPFALSMSSFLATPHAAIALATALITSRYSAKRSVVEAQNDSMIVVAVGVFANGPELPSVLTPKKSLPVQGTTIGVGL